MKTAFSILTPVLIAVNNSSRAKTARTYPGVMYIEIHDMKVCPYLYETEHPRRTDV